MVPAVDRRRTPLRWLFESRETGRVTLAQWPNPPLWLWIATSVLHRLVPEAAADALALVGTVALAVWATLELWSGVNPFRRALGFAVLLYAVLSALT